jgi:hypothetical protein
VNFQVTTGLPCRTKLQFEIQCLHSKKRIFLIQNMSTIYMYIRRQRKRHRTTKSEQQRITPRGTEMAPLCASGKAGGNASGSETAPRQRKC